jgi:hypothetical protein
MLKRAKKIQGEPTQNYKRPSKNKGSPCRATIEVLAPLTATRSCARNLSSQSNKNRTIHNSRQLAATDREAFWVYRCALSEDFSQTRSKTNHEEATLMGRIVYPEP